MADERAFVLYDTLTNQEKPLDLQEPGVLRFYSCGPTVYSYAHIGNFRTFLTADLIVRTARALGWTVQYVSNVTDVGHLTDDDVADAEGEDKMAKALKSKEGERFANVYDLARHYTDALQADWRALNLIEPDVRPRATEHMREQIEAIDKLVADGHAYETEDAVYFAVDSFPTYGKLSGNDDAETLAQHVRAGLVHDGGKRDPRDFALWKKDAAHLMQWHSPWGWGFPGWHLECSVMAMRYLGETLDLHAGGEDLIFPHHECEVAQSESLTGKPFARHWAHTRFLQVEGEKMSKSKGNFFTVRDLVAPEAEGGRGVDPLALRWVLMSGHYRKPFNFTEHALRDAARHVRTVREIADHVAAQREHGGGGDDRVGERLHAIYDRALDALTDDLNTPAALAAFLEGVRLLRGMGGHLNAASAAAATDWLDRMNALLGLVHAETPDAAPNADEDPLKAQVEGLLEQRTAARKARDWPRADAIRDDLDALGVEVMDTPTGPTWRRKL